MSLAVLAAIGLVAAVVVFCLIAVLGGPEINCECDERHVHRPE